MCPTTGRLRWGLVARTLVTASLLLWAASGSAGNDEKKPATLDVQLPEDATLEVEGYKTKATGELRHFQSPPLEPGHTYAYSLQVKWQRRTLTRKVRLRPGELTKVDLRPSFLEPETPAPVGSFHLLVPPAMTLAADQSAPLPLRVQRTNFNDPIRITFTNLPNGVTGQGVTLAAGETDAKANLSATADAPWMSGEIRIVASSGASQDSSTLLLRVMPQEKKSQTQAMPRPVQKAERKPEKKPEVRQETKTTIIPKPKEQPSRERLQLVVPAHVEVEAGRTRYIEIQVKSTDGSLLLEKPEVTLVSAPEDQVTATVWTASNIQDNPNTFTMGLVFKASAEASEGVRKVKIRAVAGVERVERGLDLVVKPPRQKAKPETRTSPALKLVVPEQVVLAAGRRKYVEVQVTTADGSSLPGEPAMALSATDSAVQAERWTTTPFRRGDSVFTVGLAITAARDASTGEHVIAVAVSAGDSKAERRLKVQIKSASQ